MNFASRKDRTIQLLLEKGLVAPPDVTIFLGDRVRQWAPYVRIETRALWAAEPLRRKLAAVLRGRWKPDMDIANDQALDTYRQQIFGGDDDWGDHLIGLYAWHLLREWNLDALTEHDETRAGALASFTVLTRLRYSEVLASPLNLRLGIRAPTSSLIPVSTKPGEVHQEKNDASYAKWKETEKRDCAAAGLPR
jgi:hypothetical protein